tara:strand:+ start:36793 stop:37020 length:228 start_codon:yes stop_codon:yes gene_type:complete
MNNRIYPNGVFDEEIKKFQEDIRNGIFIKQRDENINAIIEDREPKEIIYGISKRQIMHPDGHLEVLGYDIIEPEK